MENISYDILDTILCYILTIDYASVSMICDFILTVLTVWYFSYLTLLKIKLN
jgi:hypothetical protein